MKKVYPAIFEKDPVGYGIYFPDIEGAVTQSKDIIEGLEVASDALGIMLGDLVENNKPLPKPTNINDLSIDSEREFATLISVNLNDYLKDVQLDKKTIKIPHWLNVRATNEGINFSKTMSEALVQKLNI
ncbi:type II toxin-antitoxin system HicB family antitoxin [Enterococcus mundtii]|uniref:type II toxin-antitoxin system HicB family antitoxin n=1 Tax=Enterococcus TaxID=1350 RepID=UPI00115A9416|nr:type II toxin-antitoxin system HicB family antitoxin [Enterococcus mundtii]NBA63105.1 type II toxin-antitoxin system HicB family antitoxin [Enterococcus mundtii]